jgi:thioredoxin-like negative regulator of GroEL
MTLEEYKDVAQLYKLANSWIEDYDKNDLGSYSSKLKKQQKEMQQLLDKTEQLIEKQSGGVGGDLDVTDLQEKIVALGESSAAFASCFGNTHTSFDSKAPVSKETTLLALELKQLTSTWYGKFSDSAPDHNTISLMASIHEKAKELIAAPKTLDGDQVSIVFYGTKSRDCRKMKRNVEIVEEEYNGLLGIELHLIEDEDKDTDELKIKNFPAVVFKRGSKRIAKHEGYLSISALQQKTGILLGGSNFSDSSSVKSITEMKSVNPKELYNMGEHLLFYFVIHNCGECKRMAPIVNSLAHSYHNVKFEQILADNSHNLHTSFGVYEFPALVFVHDGKVVGKHTGFLHQSTLKRRLKQFAISNKKNMGNTTSGQVSYLKAKNEDPNADPNKGKKIKDKTAPKEEEA